MRLTTSVNATASPDINTAITSKALPSWPNWPNYTIQQTFGVQFRMAAHTRAILPAEYMKEDELHEKVDALDFHMPIDLPSLGQIIAGRYRTKRTPIRRLVSTATDKFDLDQLRTFFAVPMTHLVRLDLTTKGNSGLRAQDLPALVDCLRDHAPHLRFFGCKIANKYDIPLDMRPRSSRAEGQLDVIELSTDGNDDVGFLFMALLWYSAKLVNSTGRTMIDRHSVTSHVRKIQK